MEGLELRPICEELSNRPSLDTVRIVIGSGQTVCTRATKVASSPNRKFIGITGLRVLLPPLSPTLLVCFPIYGVGLKLGGLETSIFTKITRELVIWRFKKSTRLSSLLVDWIVLVPITFVFTPTTSCHKLLLGAIL